MVTQTSSVVPAAGLTEQPAGTRLESPGARAERGANGCRMQGSQGWRRKGDENTESAWRVVISR